MSTQSASATLAPDEVTTVTITGEWSSVLVGKEASDEPVFFTVDSDTAPTVAGDDTDRLYRVACEREVPSPGGGTVVKLISAAAAEVYVKGVQRR